MTDLVLRYISGDAVLEVEALRVRIEESMDGQANAEVAVEAHDWLAIEGRLDPRVDEFEVDVGGVTEASGRYADSQEREGVVRVQVASFEEDGRTAAPTPAGLEFLAVKDDVVAKDAISRMPGLNVGNVEEVEGVVSAEFPRRSPAGMLRSLARSTGAFVRYTPHRSVDYAEELGQNRSGIESQVLQQGNIHVEGNVEGLEVRRDTRVEPTHVMVLGAGEGSQQVVGVAVSPRFSGEAITTLGPLTQSSPATGADSSGNGHTLTENGSPADRTSPESKYGIGYDLDGTDDFLSRSDAALVITGDLSAMAAIEFDDAAGAAELILQHSTAGEAEADNIVYQLNREPSGAIQYFHESGAGVNESVVSSGTPLASAGFYTITLTRDVSTKTVVVTVNGVEAINTTYTNNPTGGTSGELRFGEGQGGGSNMDGGVYEARIWDSLVAQATLDEIADPDDDTYKFTAEGTELGLWFLGTLSQETTTSGRQTGRQVWRRFTDRQIQSNAQARTQAETIVAELNRVPKSLFVRARGVDIDPRPSLGDRFTVRDVEQGLDDVLRVLQRIWTLDGAQEGIELLLSNRRSTRV